MLAACGSCHSRRVERAPWTPGTRFLDAFEPELFDTDAYYPDGQVREELYELVSFQSSRMYAEGVRCWNCHDAPRRRHAEAGQRTCAGRVTSRSYEDETHTHHPAGSAGAPCTGCHMPVTVYMQRDPRHDHSFGVPDPELTVALGVPNACNRCHTDRDAAWAAERVRDLVSRRRRARASAARSRSRSPRAGAATPTACPRCSALLGGAGPTRASRQRRASAGALPHRARASPPRSLAGARAILRRSCGPGAAWALAQRPSLAPSVRDGMVAALDDPVLTVRLHAAVGLRGDRSRHAARTGRAAPSPAPPPSGAPARRSARTRPSRTTTWPSSSPPTGRRPTKPSASTVPRCALAALDPGAAQPGACCSRRQGRARRGRRRARDAPRQTTRCRRARSRSACSTARWAAGSDAAAGTRSLPRRRTRPTHARATTVRSRSPRPGDTTAALDELERAAEDPGVARRGGADPRRSVAPGERQGTPRALGAGGGAHRPRGAGRLRAHASCSSADGGYDASGGGARRGIQRGTQRR